MSVGLDSEFLTNICEGYHRLNGRTFARCRYLWFNSAHQPQSTIESCAHSGSDVSNRWAVEWLIVVLHCCVYYPHPVQTKKEYRRDTYNSLLMRQQTIALQHPTLGTLMHGQATTPPQPKVQEDSIFHGSMSSSVPFTSLSTRARVWTCTSLSSVPPRSSYEFR